MAGAHRAAADAAPRHCVCGIGQGDGWLRRHRLQVTSLGSPGVWAENETVSPCCTDVGTGNMGVTRHGGGRDTGGGCIATPAPALPPRPQHGVTAVPPPAQRPRDHLLRVCSGLVCRCRPLGAITLMTLGSGLEKSAVPPRHCRVPKLAPGCPERSGGGGSPPASPVPQESGKLRYGNGCKAHPPRAPRRELRPIPNPPARHTSEQGRGRLPREILSANSRLKA